MQPAQQNHSPLELIARFVERTATRHSEALWLCDDTSDIPLIPEESPGVAEPIEDGPPTAPVRHPKPHSPNDAPGHDPTHEEPV